MYGKPILQMYDFMLPSIIYSSIKNKVVNLWEAFGILTVHFYDLMTQAFDKQNLTIEIDLMFNILLDWIYFSLVNEGRFGRRLSTSFLECKIRKKNYEENSIRKVSIYRKRNKLIHFYKEEHNTFSRKSFLH